MNENYQITDIQVKKNNINKIQLFVNDQLFIETDDNILRKLDLYIGKIVSKKVLDSLEQQNEVSKARNDAIRFLSYRPRSEWEVRKKLEEKKYQHDIIEDAIYWLKDENLVNDWEFSWQWLKYQVNKKPAGKIKLKNELYKKRINREIIESVIDSFFEQDNDELELAYQLIEKKSNSLQSKNIKLEPQKVLNLLKSQGFSPQIIQKIYEEKFEN
jgi:regulatory protein